MGSAKGCQGFRQSLAIPLECSMWNIGSVQMDTLGLDWCSFACVEKDTFSVVVFWIHKLFFRGKKHFFEKSS